MPGGMYRKPSDLPGVIPIFPLPGAIVFPRGTLPLNIFEPRYLNMVDDVMSGGRLIGMIQPAGPGEDKESPRIAEIGCAARVTAYAETEDGRYLITLTGVSRFRVVRELPPGKPYREVEADFEPYGRDLATPRGVALFDRPALLDALSGYLTRSGIGSASEGLQTAPEEALINTLAAACPFEPAEKQALLEAPDLAERATLLKALFETAGRKRLI